MPKHPPESLKAFADRLATSFLSPEGSEVFRFLRLSGLLDPSPAPAPAPEEAGHKPPGGRVGVWDPTAPGGAYVRAQETAGQWAVWAQKHRIAAKSSKKRVVLIGESAARGLFYDPKFNPAQALTASLATVMGSEQVEVVDLAKSGIYLPELRQVAESAFDLKPDVLVIFAGSNWLKALHTDASSAERFARANAVREHGLAGLREFCDQRLASETAGFLGEVAERAGREKVRIVVVVPEYNLGDWRQNATFPPWLDGEAGAAWWACEKKLSPAIAAGEFAGAATLAEELIRLDQGTCATGLYALAECRRKTGRVDEVRGLLERARDVCLWDPFFLIYPPACVQEALRQQAQKLELVLVDLPRVFEAHLDGGVPDRRLFLDYVHLTVEGIEVAAAAIAAAALPLLGVAGNHAQVLRTPRPGPSAAVIAEAHLAAAMHNAHFGQGSAIVGHHCTEAIKADGGIATMMGHLVEMSSRRAPAWVCRATAELATASNSSLIRFLLGHLAVEPTLMDRVLRREICRSLGTEFEQKFDALRNQEYGGANRVSSLELPYFAVSSLGEREANWSSHRAARTDGPDYFLAYRDCSKFALLEETPRAVDFCLTVRVPGVGERPPQPVIVEVNGEVALETTVGSRWQTARFSVAAKQVRTGENEIIVRWPTPAPDASRALERAADQIERGNVPEFYPVYGEIHSFKATNG